MEYDHVELLLAEDNINDAELAIRELDKHQLADHLFHVKDGEEALHFMFARGAYEGTRSPEQMLKVVLLDIQMPKVNGIEVLQRIRGDERTKNVPLVMLTASRQESDIRQCYELGANSYIVKPVGFKEFAEIIRNLGIYWLQLNEKPISGITGTTWNSR